MMFGKEAGAGMLNTELTNSLNQEAGAGILGN